MPEDQNYNGDQWNIGINNFLTKILKWKQIGTSNIDVICGPNNEPMGLDSVFGYRTHERSHQQVVIIEAKNRDNFKALSRAEIQRWIDRLLKKVELTPPSQDFQRKFPTDADAQYGMGLLAVWVRDTDSFDTAVLADRLKQIEVPDKRNPIYLYVLDNERITRVISVYDEINRLLGTEEYKDCLFFYPANGSDILCDGTVLPIEVLFSDILFYRVTKREYKRSTGTYDEYESVLCFYFGDITSIGDFRFIDLAIRDSGLQNAKEFEVYITASTDNLRSEIDAHTRDSRFKPTFKRLSLRSDLPSWLGDE